MCKWRTEGTEEDTLGPVGNIRICAEGNECTTLYKGGVIVESKGGSTWLRASMAVLIGAYRW